MSGDNLFRSDLNVKCIHVVDDPLAGFGNCNCCKAGFLPHHFLHLFATLLVAMSLGMRVKKCWSFRQVPPMMHSYASNCVIMLEIVGIYVEISKQRWPHHATVMSFDTLVPVSMWTHLWSAIFSNTCFQQFYNVLQPPARLLMVLACPSSSTCVFLHGNEGQTNQPYIHSNA